MIRVFVKTNVGKWIGNRNGRIIELNHHTEQRKRFHSWTFGVNEVHTNSWIALLTHTKHGDDRNNGQFELAPHRRRISALPAAPQRRSSTSATATSPPAARSKGCPNDRQATFIHGVFDAAPIVITELANAPDWLPFVILLNGERFSLASGTVEAYRRTLDLRNGLLSRTVRWRSPYGRRHPRLQRFASLADPHTLCIRCQAIPEFEGRLEFRLAINGNTDNEAGPLALAGTGIPGWDRYPAERNPPYRHPGGERHAPGGLRRPGHL